MTDCNDLTNDATNDDSAHPVDKQIEETYDSSAAWVRLIRYYDIWLFFRWNCASNNKPANPRLAAITSTNWLNFSKGKFQYSNLIINFSVFMNLS